MSPRVIARCIQGSATLGSHGVVSPYATGFAAEALFVRQRGRDAIQLIESVWGPMADTSNPNYSGGHWEAMTADGKPFGHDTSLMHAWSSWPVFLLPQYVVGVKSLGQGWRNIEVAPVLCGINYAHYDIETPQGRLEVEVNWDEAVGILLIKVTLPSETKANIVAPQGYLNESSSTLEGPFENAVFELRRL
ncbi:hypothetical protein ColLi_08347 [Colletotrichum liriopes]|uniref:Alpha-L-rhamnosidase C-terminal domain-containing protein n=1 Tax=Colletotrichum liriopes TaxID=708192 RepID=A0AA37LUP6_9PEZI|nr:hypothetical protein ColLi_08347 [Colletotrichum liriopes]